MFGKKDEKPAGPNAMNQFGQGTVITGDVSTEGDVRIDGKITGNVTSKSKVVIGASGAVDGDIVCQNAYIDGRVTGNIEVAETLILSGTASISGNIKLRKLVVQEGAKFNGNCSMGLSVTLSGNGDQPVARPKYSNAV